MNILDIRGIDVSYSFICDRRLWLSLHGDVISDGSEFVYEGKNLESLRKIDGYVQIKIGRNRMDKVEIRDDYIIIHEFKRGRKAILPDIMQVAHYINIYKQFTEKNVKGLIHLSSKRTVPVELDLNILNELNKAYLKIEKISYDEFPPPPVKNYYCFRGCSLVEYCWGKV
jgi:CRISPR-associated exonuclease Cas4